MRIGIIAEFNPLHSGHKYLIEQAQNLIAENGSGGEIVCVMSEYFTQRGEVAITDGYTRAKEAVRSGCSLVVALPYLGSVAYSDDFARKSIEILDGAGITHLIFGTEEMDIEVFGEIYKKQQEISPEKYRELLKQGYSFAKINGELYGISNNNPNFSLAYSYYKMIKEFAPHIQLVPVKRTGQNLNNENLEMAQHLSATAIRKNIMSEEITSYISKELLEDIRASKIPTEEDFFGLLKYKIISLGKDGLKNIYDMREGLENRIFEAALSAKNYRELVELVITKRYSKKKIQRLLIHVLTNTTRDDYEKLFGTKAFRVLAVKSEKSGLIRKINKEEKITLVSVLNSSNSMYFAQDIKVARIYNLIAGKPDIFREKIELV